MRSKRSLSSDIISPQSVNRKLQSNREVDEKSTLKTKGGSHLGQRIHQRQGDALVPIKVPTSDSRRMSWVRSGQVGCANCKVILGRRHKGHKLADISF